MLHFHALCSVRIKHRNFFPSQEDALVLQVLSDFAGCQRPAAWSLLFRHLHPKIHRKIFECLGTYVIHFSRLFYSKKLSQSQTIWRGVVDVMNRKGFGR